MMDLGNSTVAVEQFGNLYTTSRLRAKAAEDIKTAEC
jgi:hypothetical protein